MDREGPWSGHEAGRRASPMGCFIKLEGKLRQGLLGLLRARSRPSKHLALLPETGCSRGRVLSWQVQPPLLAPFKNVFYQAHNPR